MKRLSLPSPAMGVALAALVVALGGTSYAALVVTSKDVKNGSLTSADLRNGTVRSADVRDRSLRKVDFRKGQLPRGATGPAGPAGVGRWALINAAGEIEAQSGGFTVASAYGSNPPGAAGNVYLDTGEDLTNNGVLASIALQNQVDQNSDMTTNGRSPLADSNPEFSGEITATRCAIDKVVVCAPPGTNTATHVVISPRLSNGQLTEASTRKRFYVVVTGDSSDVPPTVGSQGGVAE